MVRRVYSYCHRDGGRARICPDGVFISFFPTALPQSQGGAVGEFLNAPLGGRSRGSADKAPALRFKKGSGTVVPSTLRAVPATVPEVQKGVGHRCAKHPAGRSGNGPRPLFESRPTFIGDHHAYCSTEKSQQGEW